MNDYETSVAVDAIKRFAAGTDPFFLFINPFAPHAPVEPADRHRGMFAGLQVPRTASFNEADVSDKPLTRQFPPLTDAQITSLDSTYEARLEVMQSVDDMVDRVVRVLSHVGILDNTYIFFISDNGFHLGEHRMLAGKQTPYEEDIRTLLYVRGPGVAPGSTDSRFALNIDLAPTIAELAGATLIANPDGRSLVPALQGNVTTPWRKGFETELLSEPDRDEEVSNGPEAFGSKWRALRTDTYSYIEWGTGERELYRLDRDPLELTNIYPSAGRAVIGQLTDALRKLSLCAGEVCRTTENNIDVTAPPADDVIVVTAGKQQSAGFGNAITVSAAVRTASGSPVLGIPVSFVPIIGEGKAGPAVVRSDSVSGISTTHWIMGCNAGTQRLRISAPSLESADLNAQAFAFVGPPRRIDAITPPPDLVVGQSTSVTVQVSDYCGVPKPGVEVQWALAGDGSLSATTGLTGDDGRTTVTWTVDTLAETQFLTASVPSDSTIPVRSIQSTVIPDVPVRLGIQHGDGAHADVSTVVPTTIGAFVEDSFGNPVSNVSVDWSADHGGAPLVPTSTTETKGAAFNRWILGPDPGPQTMTATVAGLGSVYLAATAIGPATNVVILTGDDQTGAAGAMLDSTLTVLVTDAVGDPVSGVRVIWVTDNGTLSDSLVSTGNQGRASVRWTPANSGSGSVTASIKNNTASVVFHATVIP